MGRPKIMTHEELADEFLQEHAVQPFSEYSFDRGVAEALRWVAPSEQIYYKLLDKWNAGRENLPK